MTHSNELHQSTAEYSDQAAVEAAKSLSGDYEYSAEEYTPRSVELASDPSLDVNLEGAHNFWQKMAQKAQELSVNGKKVAAGVLLTATAVLATGCGSDVEAKPTPSVSETVEPSESETPSETPKTPELTFEQKVEAYQIPEGLSSEELAQAILDRLTMWSNAGSERGEEIRKDRLEANIAYADFLRPIADAEALPAIEALLPEDWRDHDYLVRFVEGMTDENYTTVLRYMQTNWNTERNDEGFRMWRTLEAFKEIQGGDKYRQMVIDYVNQSNQSDAKGFPSSGTFIANTMVVDGVVKLVSAEFKSR